MTDTDVTFEAPEHPRRGGIRVERGRYILAHPETGVEQSWQRVSRFAALPLDTYGLDRWSKRVMVKGLAARQDLVASAAGLDVTDDAVELDAIVDSAYRRGGGYDAAEHGRRVHKVCESVEVASDPGSALAAVPDAYRLGVAAYLRELDRVGLRVLPEMVERVTAVAEYDVAGRLDNVMQVTRDVKVTFKGHVTWLRPGDRVILDKKTGHHMARSASEIRTQLWLYARGANTAGVRDAEDTVWESPPAPVREDVAIIAHSPAGETACTLRPLDIRHGRGAAELCAAVREYRRTTSLLGTL